MEYDPKHDCYVKLVPMPARIRGLCTVNGDDTIVLINENLSDRARAAALEHEYNHIKNGDLFSDVPVTKIEKE